MPIIVSVYPGTAARSESQPDVAANTIGEALPLNIKLSVFQLATIVTFGLPTFHASLATRVVDSIFDLKASLPLWEAVRSFSSMLLAAVVAASFKTQVNSGYWFFITCSLLLASLALISSTILIISFSGDYHEHEHRLTGVDQLRYLFWSIWDLFSMPAVSTVWGTFTFIIALVIDTVCPSTVANNCSGDCNAHPFVVKVMSFLVMLLSAVRLVFFILHLRRVFQVRLGQTDSA